MAEPKQGKRKAPDTQSEGTQPEVPTHRSSRFIKSSVSVSLISASEVLRSWPQEIVNSLPEEVSQLRDSLAALEDFPPTVPLESSTASAIAEDHGNEGLISPQRKVRKATRAQQEEGAGDGEDPLSEAVSVILWSNDTYPVQFLQTSSDHLLSQDDLASWKQQLSADEVQAFLIHLGCPNQQSVNQQLVSNYTDTFYRQVSEELFPNVIPTVSKQIKEAYQWIVDKVQTNADAFPESSSASSAPLPSSSSSSSSSSSALPAKKPPALLFHIVCVSGVHRSPVITFLLKQFLSNGLDGIPSVKEAFIQFGETIKLTPERMAHWSSVIDSCIGPISGLKLEATRKALGLVKAELHTVKTELQTVKTELQTFKTEEQTFKTDILNRLGDLEQSHGSPQTKTQ